jgi:4,5-dihydroxyphthalate decarboxylase
MQLTLACGRYDRTQALIDGRVRPEGVETLNYLALKPGETFWRQLNNLEFDASEMSLSSYTILRSEGDERFIAIPVFPSRVFRHSAVYLREGSPIEKPGELKGKRVGVGDYQMTAAVWVRGFLQHEYGVRPGTFHGWSAGRSARSSLRRGFASKRWLQERISKKCWSAAKSMPSCP